MDTNLDLEQMIEEIDSDLEILFQSSKKKITTEWRFDDENIKVENNNTKNTIKCLPLLIGDGNQNEGCSRVTQPYSCNRLRCYSCDLPVTNFPGHRWRFESDPDIFLRLYAPWDKTTLLTQLIKAKGTRAFCCQCQHFIVDHGCGFIQPPTTWYCRGH